MAVIAIIGILAAALVTSVTNGFKNARQTDCKSKLRQFGIAVSLYRGEHDDKIPDWISNLYPEYVDDRGLYVCLADSLKGRGQLRPPAFLEANRTPGGETIDGPAFRDNQTGADTTLRNRAIQNCSYLFEFSAAPTSWRVPNAARGGTANSTQPYTMGVYKVDQMTYGDTIDSVTGQYLPWSASRIPILRCFHHSKDQWIWGRWSAGGAPSKMPAVLNVAYAGNIFVSPPQWELTIRPEDRTN